MELDWLETLIAVADRGGFTAAAEHVHRSQSRVSAHVAALEREIGVLLVDRSHRPATLTAAGEVFLAHAREIVTGVVSARAAVRAMHGAERGWIRLLTTPCIGPALCAPVIAPLAAEYPALSFHLQELGGRPDAQQLVLADGLAAAVLPRLAAPLPPGLRERVLWSEPLVVLATPGHELAAGRGAPVPVERFARYPLLVCGLDDDGPDVLRLLAERGPAVRPLVRVEGPGTLVTMVRAGFGVGITTAVGAMAAGAGDLVVRTVADPRLVRQVAGYWYDFLLDSAVGRRLHQVLCSAPVPDGATPATPRDSRDGTPPAEDHRR